MAQGKSAISKKKPPKSQGGVKKKLGKTKKGLKKQVKSKKTDQIISKGVSSRDFETGRNNIRSQINIQILFLGPEKFDKSYK